MTDHTPVRFDPHRTSGTTGLPIRPEYAAPMPVGDVFASKRERGMVALTREQYDAVLADHKRSIDEGWASPAIEIAAQLRQELRALETIHSGTFQERLEALGVELAGSDDPLQSLAGKFVEIALIHLRGDR